MNFKIIMYLILVVAIAGPLWVLMSGQINFHLDWRTANRESVQLAPDPKTTSEAIIQVYSARAFNWRGIFSTHTWIATKAKNANQYIVYQVIGWRVMRGLPALMHEVDIPDRRWFDQDPKIILDIRGTQAEKLIPEIAKAANEYPYANYQAWPGPNSNTFTAFVARKIPELKLALPSNAIGKDYLPFGKIIEIAPSGTGYQISLFGIIGILIAKQEGLEVNLFGAVFGVDPLHFAIKIPGVGSISLIKQ